MAYEYLSDNEFIHEIDIILKMIKTLASQAEKLAILRAEGKVSDMAYKDVQKELGKRAIVTARMKDELLSAASDRAKLIDNEITHFKHDLEILDVRHAIGAIPDAKYKTAQEGVQIQLNETEEIKRRIDIQMTEIIKDVKRIGQYIPSNNTVMPAQSIIGDLNLNLPDYTASEAISPPRPKTRPARVQSEKAKFMTCLNCGVDNLVNASYCYYCGIKLEKEVK